MNTETVTERLRMLMPQTPLRELQNNENNVEGQSSSIEGANNDPDEIQNDLNNIDNTPEYDTTRCINLEAADVQVSAQVHRLPDSDVTSNDNTTPLLSKKNGK